MKYKFLTAALAAFLMLPLLATTAYAGGGEDAEPEETATESAVTEPNPFTPDGTGTVLDNATDEDGKEFYTITTASDNVFYMIIDRQRSSENVYFLNAVTEADLLALAEPSDNVSAIPDAAGDADPVPAADPDPDPEPEAGPEPEATGGGNSMGTLLLVMLVGLGGGGAGYYFKVLRPKQQAAAPEDDYPESEYE
ncbi:MAG: DUF4366 domain-containing protein, partial [Clostridiales bacterium]|nr:DUF4366 domain-containing protein [Clostridiales bacterium]